MYDVFFELYLKKIVLLNCSLIGMCFHRYELLNYLLYTSVLWSIYIYIYIYIQIYIYISNLTYSYHSSRVYFNVSTTFNFVEDCDRSKYNIGN